MEYAVKPAGQGRVEITIKGPAEPSPGRTWKVTTGPSERAVMFDLDVAEARRLFRDLLEELPAAT